MSSSSMCITREEAWYMFIEKVGNNVHSLQSLFVVASGTVSKYGKRPQKHGRPYRCTILLTNVQVSILPGIIIDHVWTVKTNALGATVMGSTIAFSCKIKEYAPPKFTFRDAKKLKRPPIVDIFTRKNQTLGN